MLGWRTVSGIFRLQITGFYVKVAITMSHTSADSSTGAVCKRLGHVKGFDGRENEIIVCHGRKGGVSHSQTQQHVIYFGGDVQDYPENMERYNADHKMWNLENTAKILQSKFQQSTVFVIKPSEMLLKTFSIYRNFLFFDEDGRPEFSTHSGALMHLAGVYANAYKKLLSKEEHESTGNGCGGKSEQDPNIPIKLIGFSKGCVVLNQLMFELETCQAHPPVSEFLQKVNGIYWVDGGHTGRKNAYITDKDVLQHITDLNVQLQVHVTPYQVRDVNRPWIGREEKEFVETLTSLNANIMEFQHFTDEPGSLNNHWKVLTKI